MGLFQGRRDGLCLSDVHPGLLGTVIGLRKPLLVASRQVILKTVGLPRPRPVVEAVPVVPPKTPPPLLAKETDIRPRPKTVAEELDTPGLDASVGRPGVVFSLGVTARLFAPQDVAVVARPDAETAGRVPLKVAGPSLALVAPPACYGGVAPTYDVAVTAREGRDADDGPPVSRPLQPVGLVTKGTVGTPRPDRRKTVRRPTMAVDRVTRVADP